MASLDALFTTEQTAGPPRPGLADISAFGFAPAASNISCEITVFGVGFSNTADCKSKVVNERVPVPLGVAGAASIHLIETAEGTPSFEPGSASADIKFFEADGVTPAPFIPEPSTFSLLGTALALGVIGFVRRRTRVASRQH